jgi:hypothetical protein
MIKTKATSARTVLVKQSYPCLKRSDKIIVFFSASGCGVVVSVENGAGYHVGHRSGSWDMDKFFPWYGTVEITSKPETGLA